MAQEHLQPDGRKEDEDSGSLAERLMYRPVPLWIVALAIVCVLPACVCFGGLVLHARKHGQLGQAAVAIAETPHTLSQMFGDPRVFAPRRAGGRMPPALPDGFVRNTAQPVVDPGYVLLTDFDAGRHRPVIRLLRLADGAVLHVYAPDVDDINRRSRMKTALTDLQRDQTTVRYRPMHPMLMPDGGLLVHDQGPLTRIDACGRVVWQLDGVFHHSVEPDSLGNYWASGSLPTAREPGVGPAFRDDVITNVSADGRVLRQERVIDILDRNGLGYLWRSRPYSDDPLHLNDIQPVLSDGRAWKQGDLFISLRNLSLVLLYRPSTGRILWSQGAPWSFQHDVSILDDGRISVFNNHWRIDYAQEEHGEVDGINQVVVADLATGQTTTPMDATLRKLDVQTRAQGRATPLPNGDYMIEETEQGRLMRLSPDGTERWRYIAAAPNRRRLQLRWSRYLPADTSNLAIQSAERTQCA